MAGGRSRSGPKRTTSTAMTKSKTTKDEEVEEEDIELPTASTAVSPQSQDSNYDDDTDDDDDAKGKTRKKRKSVSSSKTKGSKAAATKTKKKKTTATKKKKTGSDTDDDNESESEDEIIMSDDEVSVSSSTVKKKKPKKTTTKTTTAAKSKSKSNTKSSPSTEKAKKKTEHQRITEIDELPKLWTKEMAEANGSYTFKVASWNVAGLRALVKKMPQALSDLVKKHDLDMLCLQEHKLQDIHLDDPKLNLKGLLEEEGYDEHWSFSTAKKGYSGTAVFIRRRGGKSSKQKQLTSFFAPKDSARSSNKMPDNTATSGLPIPPEMLVPVSVSHEIGKPIDNEGRTVIVDLPWATLVNVYVPNSGQKLERLDYRTKEWDKFFLEFMQSKQNERGLPVVWLGDLNIAHQALDIWNDGASHLDKQAGVTPQERESFTQQLAAGYVDAFRRLHPEAKGNYSYWSQRAGNRAPNKGLRLDYFVCSEDMFDEDSKVVVRDSYMAMQTLGSDHGPVVLEIEIKK